MTRVVEPRRIGRAIAALGIAAATLGACNRDRSDRIAADGTIELTEVDVAPFTAGRVVRVAVEEGATVRRGDTLVVLAQTTLPADIDQRRARV